MKKNEGITLIALIITIIILVILTAVTINNVIGTDLIGFATKAVGDYIDAEKEEEKALEQLDAYMKEDKANPPKLADGMIPVKYDTGKKVWVICEESDPEWYSYTTYKKRWANVMLEDGTYKDGTATVGQEVKEEDLGSMFVWIPRYAYKITSGYHQNTGTMDVVFLNGTSDEYYDKEGKTQKASRGPISDGDKTDGVYKNYIVHPAFTDGQSTSYKYGEWNQEISGIWIAKFQAGLPTTSHDIQTKVTYSNNGKTAETYYPIFKGRKFAYNYISVSDCYLLSQQVDKESNPYGLSTSANTHLLKNSEWGAVAYLSISQYGYSGGVGDAAHEKAKNNVSLVSESSYSSSPITYNIVSTPTVDSENGGKSYITAITGYSAQGGKTAENYKSSWTGQVQSLDNLLSSEKNSESDSFARTNLTDVYEGVGKSYVWNYTNENSDSGLGTTSSTTGNIYGIYDFGGCLADYTSAYVWGTSSQENTNAKKYGYAFADGNATNLATPYTTENKTNTDFNNAYPEMKNMFGDSIYELSSNVGPNTWFGQTLETDNREDEAFFPRGGQWRFTDPVGVVRFV